MDAKEIEKKLFFQFKGILYIILVLAVIALYACSPLKEEEWKAKSAVDQHLDAIKTGKSNPYDTVDISRVRNIFINVLDYKFLTILKNEKKIKKLVFNHTTYDSEYPNKEKTYEEYIESNKKIYEDDLREGKARLIGDKMEVDMSPCAYVELLYDVEITNRLGQKLYKKYVFEVQESPIKYEIVGFRER